LKSYLLKRFARIYPVYILTTFAAGLLYLIAISMGHVFNHESASNFSLLNVFFNFLGIQTWFGEPSLNGPAWSVSAEFLAYLYFPLLILILPRHTFDSKVLTLLMLFACTAFYEYSLFYSLFLESRISQVLSEFTMGLCTYIICKKLVPSKKIVLRARLILTLGLLIVLFTVKNEQFLNATVPIILLALIGANFFFNLPLKGLGRKFLVNLGLWSYSLYLSHRLLQNIMSGLNLPNYQSSIFVRLLELMMLVLLPLALAWAITQTIENPFRKLILRAK
jgi:peptidoglycan/LPS O-acetylase OafA/YrhL